MTTTDDAALSLADAFTREHHEIDAGIEAYLASGDEPARRAAPLLRALEALRRHIYLEEEIVFPHLPAGALMMPLMVMRREHGELWTRIDELAGQLADPAATADGTAVACTAILELLERHNEKEEPIIYPYMDSDLDESEVAQVRALLADGVLPDGWVCQALR
ncbi:hemerythrin domain-containing protein [Sanguibacter sp. A247]|uniref:hemerythrin domain-containing protein n=1 Tax=unclassified Sanguibacter TaxID=2645534 RepID=UPI003FD8A71F